MTETILTAQHLDKIFPIKAQLNNFFAGKRYHHAVSDVSLNLLEGETYSLVGESGSGKSTLGRLLIGLSKPDAGRIYYEGTDVLERTASGKDIRQQAVQIVFQNPFASLNPRKKIGAILEETLAIYQLYDKSERRQVVQEMLEKVELQGFHADRYPHELSGGQRQRVSIARALIADPKVLICDEAVSALDVSTQSQILRLLKQLQVEMNLTLFFITHDLGVARSISNRIGIMYKGKIVEEGPSEAVFSAPTHPYTQRLFDSIPVIPYLPAKTPAVKSSDVASEIHLLSEEAFADRTAERHAVLKDA